MWLAAQGKSKKKILNYPIFKLDKNDLYLAL